MIKNLGYKILSLSLTIIIVIIVIAYSPIKPAYDPCPAGAIMAYGSNTAPGGYLICDGSAISRTTYDHLFAAIGTTYGAGDGSTTFNLPDFRQRFLLGKATSGTGSTLGGTGGAIDHTHTVTPASLNSISLVGIGTGADDVQVTSSSNNPPFQVVNFIIKF